MEGAASPSCDTSRSNSPLTMLLSVGPFAFIPVEIAVIVGASAVLLPVLPFAYVSVPALLALSGELELSAAVHLIVLPLARVLTTAALLLLQRPLSLVAWRQRRVGLWRLLEWRRLSSPSGDSTSAHWQLMRKNSSSQIRKSLQALQSRAGACNVSKMGDVVPEMEELKSAIKMIKDANPELGAAKVHKAVKEANPTWQVSEDRVKKAIADTVVLVDGKPVAGTLKKPQTKKLSAHEEAKKKTAAAIAKKKYALTRTRTRTRAHTDARRRKRNREMPSYSIFMCSTRLSARVHRDTARNSRHAASMDGAWSVPLPMSVCATCRGSSRPSAST